jgi:hypothetical protein
LFAGCVFVSGARAKTIKKTYYVKSGFDTTGGDNLSFSASMLGQLKKSDDDKTTHDYFWPNGSYDESKYVEFNFTGQSKKNRLPTKAKIKEAKLVLEYTSTNIVLDAAKFEVWDGDSWSHEHTLNMPAVGVDSTQTVDVSSYINNRSKTNNLKVRFLASASEPSQAIFDMLKLNIRYKKH